jgi:hypothetical protein
VVGLDDGFDADVNDETALLTIDDTNGNKFRRKKLPPLGLKMLQPVADLFGDRESPWTRKLFLFFLIYRFAHYTYYSFRISPLKWQLNVL